MSIRVNIEISAEKPQDLSPVEQAVLRALSGGTLEPVSYTHLTLPTKA